ncbi:c-type cytochrome [Thalassospira alkalitolerans]|uniref:Cytochrome C n=2 Tax=Thalassospira alkalitolerans TaxID=1293890 RepID=A0A1Y2LG23_9PROT|nr:c-type cytochrome [Thalassospira alkalitolerans]OSQ49577.1 cytochrome C [Thalassospira alkalitolerans]|tara:strand:+ start:62060 stop:62455 length:396 start_codon:yes stop_codon:yes gene_type:complete
MNLTKTLTLAATIAMIAIAPAMAGDAEKGEKVFKKCAACHSIEAGKNKVGPSLAGVIGKNCGHVEDFKYGKGYQAACEKGFTIDEAFLTEYLQDPSAKLSEIAGSKERSKMSFKLKKDDQIADVIEYLKAN